jgi:hypothetical protein
VATELGAPAFGTLDELLSECDALTVVVPTPAHFAVAKAALARGKHLLVEKPIAASLDEADELLDIARRTVRQRGLTRFIAAAMLSGYAWLAAGGVLFAVLGGRLVAGPPYDAALHAVFVGFVFSMIFGHAPVILPAVLRVAVPYRAWFYAHLLLLHLSLALRVGGDLLGWWGVRRWGGLLGAAAILLFLALTAASAIAAWSAARRHVREPVRPETSPPLAARGPTLIAEGQPR